MPTTQYSELIAKEMRDIVMEPTGSPPVETPKAALKELAKNSGLRLKDLLVLAPQNDPFNCGGPEQIKQATWFAQMWHEFIEGRAHIRKLFYRLVSQPKPILKPDGSPFHNTESNWHRLEDWAKFARYLGLVDARDVVDNRNPEPYIFAPDPVDPDEPTCEIEYWSGFSVPRINTLVYSDFDLPEVTVEGYHYQPGEQPYLLELWVEKSTMDEDLIPICRQYGINLVTSTGFQSVTGAIAVYSRAAAWAALGRPVRIFYLSDFDPAGDSMPIAVSRQLEFWHEQFGNDVDIKLTPLALTKEQVERYGLPTIPIKDSDARKDAFQERRGVEGAVELDALEAIYPGEHEKIIKAAIAEYQDDELEMELIDAGNEAEAIVSDAWATRTEDVRLDAEDLARRAREVVEDFQPRLIALAEEFDARMEPIREDAEALQEVVQQVIDDPDLPDDRLPPRPTATVSHGDESAWLFVSDRTFGEQLMQYRAHKGKR